MTRTERNPARAAVVAVAYVGTLVAANLLTSWYGLIPAGFGLLVTAGTYAAGLALAVRDVLHDAAGVPVVLVALFAGACLSALAAEPRIAVASTLAALTAEVIDLAVYAPLRRRNRTVAVAASGLAGAIVDTAGFLWLAGFPVTVDTVTGQLLVKVVWMTGGYLLLVEGARRVVSRQRQLTRGA